MTSIAFDLRDPARSGIARVALSLARALAARLNVGTDFDLTVCGPVDRLEALGVRGWADRPVRLVNWAGDRQSVAAERFWTAVQREVGDALWVFPHWDVPWHSLPRRYIVIVYDLILVRVPGATSSVRRLVAARWIRRAVRHADRVMVMSGFTARDLERFSPGTTTKTRFIAAGVEPAFLNPPGPLPLHIHEFTDAGPFMLSVGNRKRHKNLGMGVEVLSRVPGLRWVVVGQYYPPWDEVAARASAAGVADRMLVLDPQSDDVLCSLYHAAMCLFLPSQMEGYGLPVIEAAVCGTPVVCSNAGSLPEVAGSCASLCNPDDARGFALAVEALRATSARQSVQCVERARAMTWDAAAGQLLDTIREIA